MEKAFNITEFRGHRAPSQRLLEQEFPEWIQFERLLRDFSGLGEICLQGFSRSEKFEMPLVSVTFGSSDPSAPALGIFGGVHGLERIGSQVVLALFEGFLQSLLWDEVLQETLKKIRLVFYPFVNPLGILNQTRANPSGVDLMRNSPTIAIEKPTWLLGGQKISSKLPWYQGENGIEPEAQAVIQVFKESFQNSKALITVDFHSGFGLQDQIWFPYAKTKAPFPHLPEFFAFCEIYEKAHPHHFYRIEPQALNYTTHGDLWDYLYDEYYQSRTGVYLPMALEMGSWMWMKKNPLQVLTALGAFHPIKPHRHKRVLRRHQNFFEFLIRIIASNHSWTAFNLEQRNRYLKRALEKWYQVSKGSSL